MNFEDLLDEDGRGGNNLDVWIAENISSGSLSDYKHYTGGNSIDPIWKLATNYFPDITLNHITDNHSLCLFTTPQGNVDQTTLQPNDQLAIAEALFKTHQKEENE